MIKCILIVEKEFISNKISVNFLLDIIFFDDKKARSIKLQDFEYQTIKKATGIKNKILARNEALYCPLHPS